MGGNPTVLPCARGALRRAVRLPATLVSKSGLTRVGTLVDLSPRGAQVETTGDAPPVGTLLRLSFVPPSVDGVLVLDAEVVRSCEPMIALRWEGDLGTEALLADVLVGLPPPVSGARPTDAFFGVADADELAEALDDGPTAPESGVFALLDPANLQLDEHMLEELAERLAEEDLLDDVVEILDDEPALEDDETVEIVDDDSLVVARR